MGSYTGGISAAEPNPVAESSPLSNNVDKILNSIFRTDEKRVQLWPERLVRSGATAAGDVASGKVPTLAIDPVTGDVHTSPEMIEKAQEMSALAGTGGLAGGGGSLNATPSLRPALKYKEKLYKGKPGQEHMDVIPKELYPEFQKMAMSGEDISHYNFGFVNDKGHFLNREDALKYGIDNGLIDPHAGKYGALTSTLFSDSSKPGTAIEALAKKQPNWELAKSIDANLKGEVAKALDTWVGGPHNSLETGFGGGVWHPNNLKAVLKNPELNAELEASIKPFKDDLRAKHGDTVTLYRYHGKIPEGAKPDRELLSFTSDPSVTDKMAQIQPPKKSFTDADIKAKEKEFSEKGEVKVGRYTLKKNEYDSLDIDDPSVGGFLTDTPSVSEWMKELNGYAKAHNEAQADKSKLIYKKEIPIDDIVYATDRFGQKEFIVKNKNKDMFSKSLPLPPGYELKPIEFNPFELKT